MSPSRGTRSGARPARAEDGKQAESDEAEGHGREQEAAVRLMSHVEECASETALAQRIGMPRRDNERGTDDSEHEPPKSDSKAAEPEGETLLGGTHALGLEIPLEASAQGFDDLRDPRASDPAQAEDGQGPRPDRRLQQAREPVLRSVRGLAGEKTKGGDEEPGVTQSARDIAQSHEDAVRRVSPAERIEDRAHHAPDRVRTEPRQHDDEDRTAELARHELDGSGLRDRSPVGRA